MLTDEELPPIPRFSVTKWMFTGLMAWSLFFGAIGGLAILLLADFGPEEISPTRHFQEKVVAVDSRVSALEERTNKLNDQHLATQQQIAGQKNEQEDSQLTRILIGLTQLKTAYDNEKPLSDGIATLKQTIKDANILKNLDELEKVTAANFPTKEKILEDLQGLETPSNATLKNEKGEQSLDWRVRAKTAFSQLVRVTPTKNIIKDKDVDRVFQAVASGDYDLAEKFARHLPNNPSSQIISSEIATRSTAQNLVQKIISQVSSAVGKATGQNGLY